MNRIVQIILIIFIALFQIIIMPFLAFHGIWPNLILIFLVLLILNGFDKEGFLVAGIGGLMLDFASIYFFGFYTLILITIAIILFFLNQRYLNEPNFYLSLIILALCVVMFDSILLFLSPNLAWFMLSVNIIYSIVIAWPIYHLLGYYHKKINGMKLPL